MVEASVKIPEGKMVKVSIKDEEVEVRGDFFLEPPEKLDEIEEKLEQIGQSSSEEALDALNDVDADFIGFSREHVAEAFEEAWNKQENSSDSSSDVEWRLINEGEYSEAMHHAIDEVLSERMEEGEIRPTIRIWYRENPSVPFGRFQAIEDEVETEYADENDVEVVRRITGGGAMFAEPGNVITYSIYLPKENVSESIEDSYRELDRFAVEALQEIGVGAIYKPLNDIEHEEGKLGGAAQLRKSDTVLHHTTISYDLDTEEMLRVLRIGKEKVSDKAIKSAEQRVSSISDHVETEREEVIQKMIEKFSEDREVVKDDLTDQELEDAKQLVEEKFSNEEWNRKL